MDSLPTDIVYDAILGPYLYIRGCDRRAKFMIEKYISVVPPEEQEDPYSIDDRTMYTKIIIHSLYQIMLNTESAKCEEFFHSLRDLQLFIADTPEEIKLGIAGQLQGPFNRRGAMFPLGWIDYVVAMRTRHLHGSLEDLERFNAQTKTLYSEIGVAA